MAKIIFSEAQLSQYVPGSTAFTWKDALFSNEAKSHGLLNEQYSPDQSVYDNIIALFEQIINPLYAAFPGQFRLNSVYRSPVVNDAIGGAKTSQHLKGQAVDIDGIGSLTNREIFNWLIANRPFDQIIWEFGSEPTPANTVPVAGGNPDWVHCSFDKSKPKQRGKITRAVPPKPGKYVDFAANQPSQTPEVHGNDQDTPAAEGKPSSDKKTEDLNGNQEEGPNFQATFEQIARNIANTEASDVDVTWGKRLTPAEDSDWIGLKQFLLYLASRFSPQSLFPFVELIPIISVDQPIDAQATQDELNKNGYVSEGSTPKDVENNLAPNNGDTKDKAKLKNKLRDQVKFNAAVPPGYSKDRFAAGASASNSASNIADMFTLDPFKEGMDLMGVSNASGDLTKDQRNVGVRVYGQLVLSPGAIEGTPSKPGAIGFKSLEIQAGSQADNGLAMIKMTLVDVQGNKFTDINSPWSFIYDTRPGSIGGDFYFRYGWQIRVPDPRDSSDPISAKFWHHPGWLIFDNGSDQGIKSKIMEQIIPGKQVITLTQAINTGVVVEDDSSPIALFDEGISFEEEGGTVKVSRAILASPDNNYVRLSLLNPELDMDDNGAITATLSFRTTGSIVFTLPLDYAITTRRLLTRPAPRTRILLGDLLLALQNDADNFGFIAIKDRETRLKQSHFAEKSLRQKAQDRNFDGYVLIQGPDTGGNTGDIHPDEILIDIDSKHMDMLMTSQKETGVTLIRWFREVLQDNECELLSAATGSGAGINSAWIITTTRDKGDRLIIKKQPVQEETTNSQTIEVFKTEKDVFSYRFQGSLVNSIKVEKTEAPNAMKIQTDFAVGDLETFDIDAGDAADVFSKPVSASDRQRNLKVIFSQMQNCHIECLCHPWLGPGKRIYVKGMGFFDGEYQVIEVTHKLDGHRFVSEIKGARILMKSEEAADKVDNKNLSAANGNSNFSQPVTKQLDTSSNPAKKAKPPISSQSSNQNNKASTTTSVANTPTSTPNAVTAVPTVLPVKNTGNLQSLSVEDANKRLGYLATLKDNSEWIATFTKAPSSADINIANAFWCEMRKGNGVDYAWLDVTKKRNVEIINGRILQAITEEALNATEAITLGSQQNAKYTISVGGSVQTIGD